MKGNFYAFKKTYGIDLGSSSIKVYSFLKTKLYGKEHDSVKRAQDHRRGQ